MSSFMLRIMRKSIVKWVLSALATKAFKKEFATRLNKIVNIPGLNEEEEEVIFLRTYDALMDLVENFLSK